MNDTGLIPLNDIVLVEPEKVEEVSKGGIVLARQHVDSESLAQIHGKVIAMGEACHKHPATRSVKPGDTVVFGKYSGLKYVLKEVVYRLIRAEDIIARMEDSVERDETVKARARQTFEPLPPLTLSE